MPRDKRFARYEAASESTHHVAAETARTVRDAGAVAAMLEWLRFHRIPFALRSGGHCFEGFSESKSVVIDTRLMNVGEIDALDRDYQRWPRGLAR